MIHSRREGIENERPVSDLIIMYVFCFCMPSFGRGVEAPAVQGPPHRPAGYGGNRPNRTQKDHLVTFDSLKATGSITCTALYQIH